MPSIHSLLYCQPGSSLKRVVQNGDLQQVFGANQEPRELRVSTDGG